MKTLLTLILILTSGLIKSQVQFDDFFRSVKTDTIFNESKLITTIYGMSFENLLRLDFSYYKSGQLKSQKFLITYSKYNIFLYSRCIEFYENRNPKSDSLIDERKTNNYIKEFSEYSIDGKRVVYEKWKGKRRKGRGFGETFSWGTDWIIQKYTYNEFGEVLMNQRTKLYHR